MIVPGMSQETEAHLEKMLWKYDKDSFVMPMKWFVWCTIYNSIFCQRITTNSLMCRPPRSEAHSWHWQTSFSLQLYHPRHPFHQSATPHLSTLLPWVYHNGGATKVRSVQRWFGIRGLFRCSVPLKKDLWSLPRKKRFRMCKNHKKSGVRCGMSVQFVFLITVTSLSRFFLIYKNHLNCVWCLVTFPWAPSSLEPTHQQKTNSPPVTRQQQCPCPYHGRSRPICSFHQPCNKAIAVAGGSCWGYQGRESQAWSTSAWRSFHLACSGMFPIQSFLDGSLNQWESPTKKSHTFQVQYLHK